MVSLATVLATIPGLAQHSPYLMPEIENSFYISRIMAPHPVHEEVMGYGWVTMQTSLYFDARRLRVSNASVWASVRGEIVPGSHS